jgi:sugar lactone lactonase YvrE
VLFRSAFSGDALWVCDSFGRVYALNYDSGQVIRELNVEQSAAGVAYDGSYLWLAVRGTTSLQRVNIITGALIREVRLPRGDISGIDWYGGRLYVADRLSNSVLVVDDLTGVVERTLAHPGISLDGVATDGRDLWTADGAQMAIYRQDLLSAAIAPFTAPDRTPSGLCASNGFVWLGDRSGRVFKLRFP